MPEALWSQATGVTYTGSEDRRYTSNLQTAGVVFGLVGSASGTALTISPGAVIVPDNIGAGGSFLAYFESGDSNLSKTLPSTGTTVIYCKIDDKANVGTGVASLVTALPTGYPNFVVGTITTTSGVAGAWQPGTHSEPQSVNGRYVKKAGDSGLGSMSMSQVLVPGVLQADASAGVYAPGGVRLGATGNATARHWARAHLTANQSIPTNTWRKLAFDYTQTGQSDYSGWGGASAHAKQAALGAVVSTAERGRFYAAVSGTYQLSGVAWFSESGTTDTGTRRGSIAAYTSASTTDPYWRWETDARAPIETPSINNPHPVFFNATMDVAAGTWFQFEVYHNQPTTLAITTGSYHLATVSHGVMRLLQAN